MKNHRRRLKKCWRVLFSPKLLSILGLGISMNPSNASSYGSLVRLVKAGHPYCSGVLLSTQTLLTARHCLSSKNPDRIEVVQLSSGQRRAISSVKFPTDTYAFPQGDQALAFLSTPFESFLDQHTTGPSKHFIYNERMNSNFTAVVLKNDFDSGRMTNSVLLHDRDGLICPGDSGSGYYQLIEGQPKLVGIVVGKMGTLTGYENGKNDCGGDFLALKLNAYGNWLGDQKELESLPPTKSTFPLAKKSSSVSQTSIQSSVKRTTKDSQFLKSRCLSKFQDRPSWATMQNILGQVAADLNLNQSESLSLFQICDNISNLLTLHQMNGYSVTIYGVNYDTSEDYRFLSRLRNIEFVGLNKDNQTYLRNLIGVVTLQISGIESGLALDFLRELPTLQKLHLLHGSDIQFSRLASFSESLKYLKLTDLHFTEEFNPAHRRTLFAQVDCSSMRVRYGEKQQSLETCKEGVKH